jgi:hypothetical protein
MLAAYGIDVLDPRVSTRRVHVLLERLPPYARRPGEQWSTEAELLAALIDHVANLTYVTLKAYGASGVTRPTPVARPGQHRPPQQVPRNPSGNGSTGSWFDAARALAGVPGVTMRNV